MPTISRYSKLRFEFGEKKRSKLPHGVEVSQRLQRDGKGWPKFSPAARYNTTIFSFIPQSLHENHVSQYKV